MADPQTTLHYAPNANFVGNTYAPGADGFNLADVSSVDTVNNLPAGVKGLVWIGYTGGNTAAFQAMIKPFIGNPKVYGFYLADEPGPDVSAAAFKAESDYIHSADPGAKTFIVLEDNGTPSSPSFSFNPANTHIDLFGIDPYPIRPQFPGGADYSVIGDAVHAAEAQGIPQSALVPVYQAFGATSGAYASWALPSAAQEQTILSTWGQYTPSPAFDYAYSWGTQEGDTALSNDPALQAVFAAHNAGGSSSPDILTPHPVAISATVGQLFSGTVATFSDSNSSISPSALTATIDWGDGTAGTAGVITGGNGSYTVTGSHVYAASGSDVVAVTLTENPAKAATATADSTAAVSALPPPGDIMTVTDRSGITAQVPVITADSSKTPVGSGAVLQSVASGVDTVSFSRINSEQLLLGSGAKNMSFLSPHLLKVSGGSGNDIISASSGTNSFTAGTGTLDVTGGTGWNSYIYHAGDGLLRVEDFLPARDQLVVDKSLQSSLNERSDGHGGLMLTFGTAGNGIDLIGVTSLAASKMHFV